MASLPPTPSKSKRKIARKEQPHTEPSISPLYSSSRTEVKTGGDMLPEASTPPREKNRGNKGRAAAHGAFGLPLVRMPPVNQR